MEGGRMIFDLNWAGLIGVFLALCFLYLAVLIPLYNITLHPLAHYPGPKLYAAYHFPYFWHLVWGTSVHNTRKLHIIYGDTVRLQPNYLSFVSPQAWKDIYGFRQDKFQLPKDYGYDGESSNKNIIFASDKDHSRMRKLLANAFSEKAMQEQEPLLMSFIDLLIGKLKGKVENGVADKLDIMTWYNFTTFDIIGDLAFGQSFNCLESETLHSWITAIFFAVQTSVYLQLLIAYPLLYKFVKLFLAGPGQKMRKTLQTYARESVEKRLASATDRKDFMWYIKRYNDEKGMSHDEIIRSSVLLIIAGSETTATLLSGATYHLLCNPAVLAHLTSEIRTSFSHEDDITLLSVAKLDYLGAVLEESLRVYPPVPIGLVRRVQKNPELINGCIVPPHTRVAVTQYAAYHNPTNFTSPSTYAPERWLTPPPPQYSHDKLDALQAFSTGPRNCIGKNLAYVEMRLILARMLWNFDIELCAESVGWAEKQRVRSLWGKGALWVKLRMAGRGKEA